MDFTEVREIFINKNGLNRIAYISPEISGVGEWFENTIFFIEEAISGREVEHTVDELEIGRVSSLLENISNKMLMGEANSVENDTLLALSELIVNWKNLFEVQDVSVLRSINLFFLVMKTNKTINDQLDLLIMLNKRITDILVAEPAETRISKMYSDKLEEYFSRTRDGVYKVD